MQFAFVRRGVAALLLLGLAAAGCGDDSEDASPPDEPEADVEATEIDPAPDGLLLVQDGDSESDGTEIQTLATAAQQDELLRGVNGRRRRGFTCGTEVMPPVGALTLDPKVITAAEVHAADMTNKNFFSHTGSDGSDAGARLTKAGFAWSAWGENIAAGNTTVDATIRQWFASEPHCKNFMNPAFTKIGFGVSNKGTVRGTYGTNWVAVMAKPL